MELQLRFSRADQTSVRLGVEETADQPFQNPFMPKDRQDLRWYVETYGAHSLGDPDDGEAARIKAKLPEWGHALFQVVFHTPKAQALLQNFRQSGGKLITLASAEPAILALPWELLHDGQSHLFQQGVSLRRHLDETATPSYPVVQKDRLHLLFVTSRPQGAGFINPRADALALLDALDAESADRVSVEFLHPATYKALKLRLEDTYKPPVDILHFDGHGSFDEEKGIGKLLFENYLSEQAPNYQGKGNTLSAQDLGELLRQHRIPLAILSACQSSAQGLDPLGSVATGLLAQGIPAVLAMSHAVLVATAGALFGAFYQALAQGQTLPGEGRCAARDYRRLAQEAFRASPSNRVFLQRNAFLILAACEDDSASLAEWQTDQRQAGPDEARLADALDRIRAGERDAESLLDGLDYRAALILETILQGLADPASLDWLRVEAENQP